MASASMSPRAMLLPLLLLGFVAGSFVQNRAGQHQNATRSRRCETLILCSSYRNCMDYSMSYDGYATAYTSDTVRSIWSFEDDKSLVERTVQSTVMCLPAEAGLVVHTGRRVGPIGQDGTGRLRIAHQSITCGSRGRFLSAQTVPNPCLLISMTLGLSLSKLNFCAGPAA